MDWKSNSNTSQKRNRKLVFREGSDKLKVYTLITTIHKVYFLIENQPVMGYKDLNVVIKFVTGQELEAGVLHLLIYCQTHRGKKQLSHKESLTAFPLGEGTLWSQANAMAI